MTPVKFLGDSKARLREFPIGARKKAGDRLRQVQEGMEPADWKPMPSIGRGVREIRVWDAVGTFRVIYTAKLGDRIVVLHAFKKSTQATSRKDIAIARKRYREVMAG